MEISFSTDADGFLSQECPSCNQRFKVVFGEGSSELISFCPYCGHSGRSCWHTPERALLEMLSELDTHESIEETRNIMESVGQLRTKHLATLFKHCRMIKAVRLCVVWSEELHLPWAGAARQAVGSKTGGSRWIKRLKDGRTLILNP